MEGKAVCETNARSLIPSRSRIRKIAVATGLVAFLTGWPWCWGWTGAHNEAARMAALEAAGPFGDHPDWCRFGVYPDLMRDFGIAHHDYNRWATRLLVREAADALRAGDEARAYFLASVASHFPQDEACMSHSRVLKCFKGEVDPNLLPETVRPWLKHVPVEQPTRRVRRYGKGAMEEWKDVGFFKGIAAPPLLRPLYDATEGYAHDYLEDLAAALALPKERRARIVGAETLGDHEAWTRETLFPERFGKGPPPPVAAWVPRLGSEGWSFYHRWLTAHYQGEWLLPFALFDEQSLREGKPRFRDAEGLKAVFSEEFRIAVEATAALYRYVNVAAHTEVKADWGPLSSEDAKLEALSKHDVIIMVSESRRDWIRAAEFLRAELAFSRDRLGMKAEGGLRILAGADEIKEAISGNRWENAHLVRFEKARGESDKPTNRHSLRIGPRASRAERLEITLTAAVPESMGHLVDLLLDEGSAPLWSVGPPKRANEALQEIWVGVKLMAELRTKRRSPDELLEYVMPQGKRVPFKNTDQDKRRFAEITNDLPAANKTSWLRWWTQHPQTFDSPDRPAKK